MEKIDLYIRIGEFILAIVASAIVTRILTIRQRVKQEKAKTDADNIENIKSIVNDVYQPIIDDLKHQVSELREEVREVRQENQRLKDENDELRDAIREINPDAVPCKRSVNAKNQPRGKNGRFTKEGDGEYDKGSDEGYDKEEK